MRALFNEFTVLAEKKIERLLKEPLVGNWLFHNLWNVFSSPSHKKLPITEFHSGLSLTLVHRKLFNCFDKKLSFWVKKQCEHILNISNISSQVRFHQG